MRFAEEIVVEEFLPTVRSMLAEDLRDRGLTQSEVADLLGISQSAVSKYANGEVERNERILADERVRNLVSRVGEGLAEDTMSRVEALVEIEILIRRLEKRDLVAEIHEAQMPELAGHGGDFDVHDPEGELRVTERVRSSLRRGLTIVESASGFASLIPAVGSNLCECTPDADGIDDVAGVPGRIFDVKGQTTVPSEPEFGVSEHVASLLLAARRNGSDVRAALNVRYDPDIVAALEADGHEAAEFDAEYDDLDAVVGAALRDNPDATVLYHTGGYGIEPIVYLLGDDAEAVAEMARSLL
ncbi:thiamine-phosphate synthase family protein [Halorussus sp. MSC15.2]|uniref:thiamine-phosphate synthase family protein n=1 Tax=Halorussus sp. MSC15.2 TaxID=2283638 RepID=UPI0013D4A091|nr:thiamine-phosphate synthase family protein [Halorussus sp. MSC15.2]NEU57694.1 helix-turn-helix domain-containing protein [Halorussus sp. MSC15.2]